jgi:quinoprotein glucose dehydrogenase
MLMSNDLYRLAIGLASPLAFVHAPPQSSSTTSLQSQILAARLLILTLILAGLAAPLSMLGAPTMASAANSDWPAYLGDKGRSLYSPLQQINRSNVAQLKVAWTYDTGDRGEYQANNLIIAGVLYTASPTRKVIALDAATGRELWKWDARSEGRAAA